VLDFSNHIKSMMKMLKKTKKVKMKKEEKIMYIDQLTSLKNRAYLNSNIESWDESEVYPQSIIVIDLNNISYINDNHGREEGDKVITEAANILIQHQLANSEIIRTDGNEFLIYLVGYNEKQIISYLRKLSKEFKGLSHGFGAASGYSIINDAIKTIDDAVNEATLAMKENKEDIDY
jgi:diguanylate cyclase (GGDEF)-like protein